MARGMRGRFSFIRPGSASFRVAGRVRNPNFRNLGVAKMKTRAGRAGTVLNFQPGTIALSVAKSMKRKGMTPGRFRTSTRRGLRGNI